MKRKIWGITVCLVLTTALLCGCQKKDKTGDLGVSNETGQENSEDDSLQNAKEDTHKDDDKMADGDTEGKNDENKSQNSDADDADQTDAVNKNAKENEKAREAYMAFLKGEGSVKTSQQYKEDDEELNLDGLYYGAYSIGELKDCIEEMENTSSDIKYVFLDLGDDGIDEMVLRLEGTDRSFLNWNGIISYNGGNLELTYFYEDGYRSYAKLYTNGYLEHGGSMSAGSRCTFLTKLAEKDMNQDIFLEYFYHGITASSAAYDLRDYTEYTTNHPDEEFPVTKGDYSDIAEYSDMMLYLYRKGDVAKIAVEDLAEDERVKAREKELIQELVDLGAEYITMEEMNKLTDLSPYITDEVTWLEWEMPKEEELISACYASDSLLSNSDAYLECVLDESEYQVNVQLSVSETIKDIRIYSISLEDVDDDGNAYYSLTEELGKVDEIAPQKPLVLKMAFPGDMPNTGILFTDSKNSTHFYTLSQSGYDGSIILSSAYAINSEGN